MSRLGGVKKYGGPVTTSGAAVTTIVNWNPAAELPFTFNNAALHVEGVLIAKDSSNNSASLRVARSFKLISGTLSALGSQASVIGVGIGDAGLATIAGTLTTNGGIIVLQGTGIIATSIEWTGYIEIWSGEFTP